MRLIDADKIIKSVTDEMLKAELNSPIYCTLECVIADIGSQPTAYDVDKVIELLKEKVEHAESKAAEYDEQGDIAMMDIWDTKAKTYRNAIEIVKSVSAVNK